MLLFWCWIELLSPPALWHSLDKNSSAYRELCFHPFLPLVETVWHHLNLAMRTNRSGCGPVSKLSTSKIPQGLRIQQKVGISKRTWLSNYRDEVGLYKWCRSSQGLMKVASCLPFRGLKGQGKERKSGESWCWELETAWLRSFWRCRVPMTTGTLRCGDS